MSGNFCTESAAFKQPTRQQTLSLAQMTFGGISRSPVSSFLRGLRRETGGRTQMTNCPFRDLVGSGIQDLWLGDTRGRGGWVRGKTKSCSN